jgi:hypothetical protein
MDCQSNQHLSSNLVVIVTYLVIVPRIKQNTAFITITVPNYGAVDAGKFGNNKKYQLKNSQV